MADEDLTSEELSPTLEEMLESSLLPSNVTDWELVMEWLLQTDMDSSIRTLWDPQNCPAALLWVLAIVFQLDEWDEDWSETVKRDSLMEAFTVHQKKGTPYSIKRILSNAGYGDAEIIEGSSSDEDSEDTWYSYSIQIFKAISIDQAKQVKRLIEATAPLHCILDVIDYTAASFLYDGELTYDGNYTYGET